MVVEELREVAEEATAFVLEEEAPAPELRRGKSDAETLQDFWEEVGYPTAESRF
jgi:hypothetical protein